MRIDKADSDFTPDHRRLTIKQNLLRNIAIVRPDHVWSTGITYINVYQASWRIHLSCGNHSLVLTLRDQLGGLQQPGKRFLHQRPAQGADQGKAGDVQQWSGSIIHQPSIYMCPERTPDYDQHGRSGQGIGQRVS